MIFPIILDKKVLGLVFCGCTLSTSALHLRADLLMRCRSFFFFFLLPQFVVYKTYFVGHTHMNVMFSVFIDFIMWHTNSLL